MPIFEYKGLSRDGKSVKGIVDAENLRAARSKLKKDNVYVIDKGIEKIKTKSGKLFTPKEIKSILFKDLREQSPTQWMILTKEKDKNDENKELFSYMLEQLDHFAKPVPRGILQDLERAGTKMEKDGYKVINKDFELLEGVLEQLEQCWNNEKSSNG